MKLAHLMLAMLPTAMMAVSAIPIRQKKPTYAEHIRPILERKCTPCHQAGGMGPFELSTFEQTRRHHVLIRQVALTSQMPPIDASSDFGKFSAIEGLTPPELSQIQDWVRLGMPEGRKTPPISLPPSKKDPIREVELLIGKGQYIRAEGSSVVVTFAIDVPASIQGLVGFHFVPNAPRAVRQVAMAIQRKGHPFPFADGAIHSGTPVLAWSQGYFSFNSGSAYVPIHPGDRVWMRISAVPVGKRESAGGRLILKVATSGQMVQSNTIGKDDFRIEAETQAKLRSEWKLDRDIDLYSILPEGRNNTDQVRLSVDGRTLLRVHTWDPVWIGAYNFSKPVRIKQGSTLVYEATIVNTKHGHAAEEEPAKTLVFGPKQTDEVFRCHLNYVER